MSQRLIVTATVLVALLSAVPTYAQQTLPRGPRPSRNLFGGQVGDTSQLLTARLALGVTFDQDLRGSGRKPTTDVTSTGGLDYSLSQQFGKLDLGVSASSSVYYYPLVSSDVIFAQRATVSASFAFTESSTLSLNQWVSYAPYNVRGFYPGGLAARTDDTGRLGLPPAYDPAYGINSDPYLNTGTFVTFRQQITERGALDFGYSRQGAALSATADRQVIQTLRGGFSYALAKGLSARAGYSGSIQQLPTTGTTGWRGRSFDFGIDFNRALSISRSTTLTFGTGVTGVDDDVTVRYYVTGNARLVHQIGRSWTASVGYYRDVQYFDSFVDPLLGDALTADLNGVLGRKWQIDVSGGFRRGEFGIATGAPEFRSAYGRGGVMYGVTRYLGLSADYVYFNYRAGLNATLPVGLPPRSERQSLRLMVNLWVPIIANKRRP